MWRRGVAALVFSFAVVSAGEPGGGIWDFLPEVVATVDGKPIRRSELSVQLPPGAVPDRAALIPLMRRAIEAKICFALIDELLRSAGIVPSRELALEYLKQLNSLLPRGIPGTPPERFPQLASQPQFQLNAALHRCFARMAPDQIKVTDQEIETFYRLNQPQFLLPEQVDLGIIQFPASRPTAREEAETVRSRLLQGEAFDRVAREVNPEGVTLDAGAIVQLLRREQPELKVNGISRPLRAGEFWVVVKLRGKTEPAFVPLETVAPYIREQLAAAKVGRALELYLRERMQKMKIEFHLEPVAPGSPATGGPSAGSR
ncbi:peptidylprolyl isomerase [uncultured Victivallis sp.]|uniref:peptidylprolyl isomerase n=1 Tax=Victivallis sp. TaxID=2049020 RepID=UPI0025FDFBC3|nr:peptidylprolyl isomerase [uncultured Victivallis sp.]